MLPTAEKIDLEIWHISEGGRYAVRNVTKPTLTVFQPVGEHSPAIAPGRAFLGLEMDKEGWEVARWFGNYGTTAFVLNSRTRETLSQSWTR